MDAVPVGKGEPSFDRARAEDVEALVAIDAPSPRPWSADAFRAEIARDSPTLFVLRSQGEVEAFAVTRRQSVEMDIVNLAVLASKRRTGLARFLLRTLLDRSASDGVEAVFLEVRAGNREAIALYSGFGFRETQRRRAFYADPVEDAILMRLEVSRGRG